MVFTEKKARKLFKELLFWVLLEEHTGNGDGGMGHSEKFNTITEYMNYGVKLIMDFAENEIPKYKDKDLDAEEYLYIIIYNLIHEIFPVIAIFNDDDHDACVDIFKKYI